MHISSYEIGGTIQIILNKITTKKSFCFFGMINLSPDYLYIKNSPSKL